MKSLKTLAAAVVLLASGLLQSCGGGNGYYYSPVVTANSFVSELNYVDGHIFSSHRLVKDPATDTDYFVFYDTTIDEYVALDIATLRWNNYTANEAANAYVSGRLSNIAEVVDPNTFSALTATILDPYGETYYEGLESGYLYEDTEGQDKDMLYAAKMSEAFKTQEQGVAIAQQYGLSEKQGTRIATLAKNWESLSNSREMTDKDANNFLKEFAGIDFGAVYTAADKAANGDTSAQDALMVKVAKHLETTSENIRNIFNTKVMK